MNEEQHAVLAAVARMEEARSGPVDEYTVARAAGVLTTDLSGQEYAARPERQQVRRLFEELEEQGLLRLDRTGYWRPRTTLAGRRLLQHPQQEFSRLVIPRGAVPAGEAPVAEAQEVEPDHWPAWWPAAARFGDRAPGTPVLAALAGIVALLLLACVVLGARALTGGPSPTPTVAPTVAAALPTATVASQLTLGVTPTTAAGGAPTNRPTATLAPLRPTSTPRTNAPAVIVANTDNEGAFLFATPAGERRLAVPEGTELEDIGPDEQDSQGRTWKHIRYGNFEGWILEQFVVPAGQ